MCNDKWKFLFKNFNVFYMILTMLSKVIYINIKSSEILQFCYNYIENVLWKYFFFKIINFIKTKHLYS